MWALRGIPSCEPAVCAHWAAALPEQPGRCRVYLLSHHFVCRGKNLLSRASIRRGKSGWHSDRCLNKEVGSEEVRGAWFYFFPLALRLNLNEDSHGNWIHMAIKRNAWVMNCFCGSLRQSFVCGSWLILLKRPSCWNSCRARSLMEKPEAGEGELSVLRCPWHWGVSCLRLSFGEAGLSQQRYSRSCIVPVVWLIACKCAAASLYIADIFIARGRIICLSPRSEELLENGCIFCMDCFWRWGTGLQYHRMVGARVYSRTAESPLLFAGNWPCGTGNSHSHLCQSNCSFSGPAEWSRCFSNNDPPVCLGGGTAQVVLLTRADWLGRTALGGSELCCNSVGSRIFLSAVPQPHRCGFDVLWNFIS